MGTESVMRTVQGIPGCSYSCQDYEWDANITYKDKRPDRTVSSEEYPLLHKVIYNLSLRNILFAQKRGK
jgi:hypothetical protein